MLFKRKNHFDDLGYMIDCSRGAVPTIKNLKKLVDILSAFDYNYLMLYTEDVYEIDGEPYFGYMRGRYSKDEIKELDAYCVSKNMELRACIQTLAHMGRIKRHSQYTPLFEIDNILSVKNEKVYELIDKMFKSISEMFSCKKIHIGMDEAWALGRGKLLDRFGIVSKSKIMNYHLKRVSKIAENYGFECDIWADMLAEAYQECENKELFKLSIPKNITPIAWRYWVKTPRASEDEFDFYMKITNGKMGYAGGTQKWNGFVPGNTYAFMALQEQINSCLKYEVKRYLVTAWGDGGADASMFVSLPAIYYASLAAHKLTLNYRTKLYFNEVVGMKFDDFMRVDNLTRLDQSKDDPSYNNLSFIYLYNDLLQGMYDEAIINNTKMIYEDIAKTYKRLCEHQEYGYIFKTLYSLSRLLSIKASLSKEIYQHYKDKNMNGLKVDIANLKKAIKFLKVFMSNYEEQWHHENKAFGFEKQIIRLGGLKERFEYVLRQLQRYLNHEISKIDELEEERLPVSVNYWDHQNIRNNLYNNYAEIVSGGSLQEL